LNLDEEQNLKGRSWDESAAAASVAVSLTNIRTCTKGHCDTTRQTITLRRTKNLLNRDLQRPRRKLLGTKGLSWYL